jgi:ABC-type multidrug transport system permease subunit
MPFAASGSLQTRLYYTLYSTESQREDDLGGMTFFMFVTVAWLFALIVTSMMAKRSIKLPLARGIKTAKRATNLLILCFSIQIAYTVLCLLMFHNFGGLLILLFAGVCGFWTVKTFRLTRRLLNQYRSLGLPGHSGQQGFTATVARMTSDWKT